DAGQHHVEDHQVERRRRLGGELLEGPRAVRLHFHVVPLRLQVEADPVREVRLVLDDEDARHQPAASFGAPSSPARSIRPGRVTVKVEPRSGPALSAETVPRWPLTTALTTTSPRPVPV